LNHEEPMVRVFALGKLNKVLRKFENSKMSTLDQRLLKGFYITNWNELNPSATKMSGSVDVDEDFSYNHVERVKAILRNAEMRKERNQNQPTVAAKEIADINREVPETAMPLKKS